MNPAPHRVALLRFVCKQDPTGLFVEPMDTVGLGIPHYSSVIRDPIHINQIIERLSEYGSDQEFYDDVVRVYANGVRFFSPASQAHKLARRLLERTEQARAKRVEEEPVPESPPPSPPPPAPPPPPSSRTPVSRAWTPGDHQRLNRIIRGLPEPKQFELIALLRTLEPINTLAAYDDVNEEWELFLRKVSPQDQGKVATFLGYS